MSSNRFFTHIRKSILFKNVYLVKNNNNELIWVANYCGVCSYHKQERDAAISVDKMRLNKGKEAINVLVKKTNNHGSK